jgi:DNA-directed RNA polymerase specialized sigma24 family protein
LAWTVENIMDILDNHDVELDSRHRQIDRLTETLETDLEEIRHRVYPGAVQYDGIRVKTSGGEHDGRMVAVMQALDERREQHKQDVGAILTRMADIRAVYNAVLQLDAISKATLLNLYYPRATSERVAEIMGVDRGTVAVRKRKAIEKLKKVLENPAQPRTTPHDAILSPK